MTQDKFLLGWLVVGCACGSVPTPSHPIGFETETDGVFTSGVDGDEGVDETGGAPAYCIINDENPQALEGVKHMCDITYDLDVEISVLPILEFGNEYQEGHSVTNVQTLAPPSSYEHPLVNACCTDISEHPYWPVSDTCILPHQRACMSDLIQHICYAPGAWLFEFANNGIGIGSGEVVLAGASDDFVYGSLKDDCIEHFMNGSDSLVDVDLCGEDFDGGFDHEVWAPDITWTDIFGNKAYDLKVTLRSSFATGGVEVPPNPPDTCDAPPDNEDQVPQYSTPGVSGGFVTPVSDVPVEVYGPEFDNEDIVGSGDFGEDSRMHRYVEVATPYGLLIDQWFMREAAGSTAGTSSASVTVDRFKLELVGARTAETDGVGGWTIPAGSAVFNLSASIAGVGYSVPSVNDSDIDFHEVSSGSDDCPVGLPGPCLVSSAFSIAYTAPDEGDWILDVPEITWEP